MDFARPHSLDVSILKLINAPAGDYLLLDAVMRRVATDVNFKGVLIVAFMWGLWFCHRKLGPETRERLLATFLATMAAIFAARAVAMLLPFRERPIRALSDEINIAMGLRTTDLEGWSAFPSDHATMFFALATGLFLVSRKAGIAAYAHALVIISLPRVYLGLHYPSDILAGALLGIATSLLIVPPVARALASRDVMRWSRQQPVLFYGALYVLSFQLADLFYSMRTGVLAVIEIASGGVT